MRPLPNLSLALIALGTTLALPLPAQVISSSAAPIRFGIMAGASASTIGGSDAEDAERRTGFLAGLYLVKPLSGSLALRPEVLWSQKGAGTTVTEAGTAIDAELKLSYVDVPVLLQFEPATTSTIRPHLYAGPSFGFKADCSLEVTIGDVTDESDCDSDFDLKSFDMGGVIGGGIGFPLGTVSATIGARYQHGFSDIAKDAKVNNRVISLYASLEFGKR